MRNNSTFSPDESAQEIALRATLHEHAPVDINIDQAWTVVSQSLSINGQSSARSTVHHLLTWLPGKRRYPVSLKGRLVVGVVAFVAILIACTNILFPSLFGSGSVADAKQYQQIGLSQSSAGITITADKGYASNGDIGIVYHVLPPATLMKHLRYVLLMHSYIINDQNGHRVKQESVPAFCTEYYGWPLRCYALTFQFHIAKGLSRLNIIWDATDVKLLYSSSSSPFGPFTTKVLKGHWQFHILLIYHNTPNVPPPDLIDGR